MEKSESILRSQVQLQQLRHELSPFGKSDLGVNLGQLATTLIPYLGLWALLAVLIRGGYPAWMIPGPLLLATLFLVRIFILFHDCAHGSFFNSNLANRLLGYVTGFLTLTPYEAWRQPHIIHHASYADLDHRGTGDIWTLTSDEYRALPLRKKWQYRLYRHPLVLFGIGPAILFFLGQRFTKKGFGKPERRSTHALNAALLALLVIMHLTLGLRTFFLVQIPLTLLAGCLGVWLFYVQHQFDGVYWMRHADWDPMRAALEGSSYYRLPRGMRWFTGDIGIHFLHHILPRIPNYHLQAAYDATPALHTVKPLSFRLSLKSVRLNLWDVSQHKLVSFRSLGNQPPA